MDPVTAGIGAVAGLFGQGIANSASKRAATTAFKRQKDLFDYQNAYNTPANQMKRLKQAGLNPALMYGQGNTGNATGFAGVQQAKIHGVDLAQSVASGAQLSLLNAQRTKIKEEANLLREQQTMTKESAANMIAQRFNTNMKSAETIQNTLNLTTQGEILQAEKAIKKIEKIRANKGTIKGDALGNMLSILNLDPVNNSGDRKLIQGALIAYFGAKVAGDIMKNLPFNVFKKGGK